jgi:hypothetical protein
LAHGVKLKFSQKLVITREMLILTFCIFCASASTMEATNLLSICCDILCRTGVKTNGKKNLIFYLSKFGKFTYNLYFQRLAPR